ncbi:MAG: HNH endonuclease [Candidatus Thermoplasmatota archaeon]|jgi:5-methylcytosine-specific restriction endonuclease McrA|nr:HNH endonuclease [Candidatus Thermoplasmatota archaeon]
MQKYDWSMGKIWDDTPKRKSVKTSIKKEVIARQKYHCYKCKELLPATYHIHHKKSVSSGGSNRVSNLIALCPNCHADIHHKKRVGTKRKSIHKKKSSRKNRSKTSYDYSISRVEMPKVKFPKYKW